MIGSTSSEGILVVCCVCEGQHQHWMSVRQRLAEEER